MTAGPGLKLGSSIVVGAAALYLLVSYLFLPAAWRGAEELRQTPRSMVTLTAQGIPADPINIGLVGTRDDILHAFEAAKWQPADPVTLRSSITIGASVLLDRPDPKAPVSSLFYDGRRQDFAFEKESGESAAHRHHLRLWETPEKGENGHPLWLGAASFDRGVELSRHTGQITHSIAADLDAERARVMEDLAAAGFVRSTYEMDGVGPTGGGRNGNGDRYVTDGKVIVAVISD